jgi:pyridoxal phosphate enzyme (YggS family)
MTTIADELYLVRASLEEACARYARPAAAVQLLAVSKTFGPQAVREAFEAGQIAFGENYIQEAVEKMALLSDLPLEWHCIGPVQSNKTRLVAESFDWLHSLDRLKIAERLSAQRPQHRAPLQVCIQVNVDGGVAKSGVAPGELLALARAVAALPGLVLRGLMSIPEPTDDVQQQRHVHRAARRLFEEVAAAGLPASARWDTLSMGMSADMEAAVAEGSTMVRVGSAIFGRRG